MKMIKYVLISALVMSAGLINAQTGFQHLIELKKTILDHKAQWLKWEGETHQQKYDLLEHNVKEMKQHLSDNAASIKNLMAAQNTAGKNQEELADQQTQSLLALHETHMKAMHDFWQKKHEEAQKLFEKQEQELAKFRTAGYAKQETLLEKLSRAWNSQNIK
ncbi:hypothetical protein HYX58_02645 [Candidatus Dependentiae bacterium]|nr:hypothetical protein [Candidatus Dependentiae bacterium]